MVLFCRQEVHNFKLPQKLKNALCHSTLNGMSVIFYYKKLFKCYECHLCVCVCLKKLFKCYKCYFVCVCVKNCLNVMNVCAHMCVHVSLSLKKLVPVRD